MKNRRKQEMKAAEERERSAETLILEASVAQKEADE
jgi:hypothetical protein